MVVTGPPAPVKRPEPVSGPLPKNVTTSLLLMDGPYAAVSLPMPGGGGSVPGPAIVTNAPFLARITKSKPPGAPDASPRPRRWCY